MEEEKIQLFGQKQQDFLDIFQSKLPFAQFSNSQFSSLKKSQGLNFGEGNSSDPLIVVPQPKQRRLSE